MKKVSVQCQQVRLSYGTTEVLKDVSVDIAPGEFFALLGPSGSGKSTLLRLIAGFNVQQSGQVLIDGQDVSTQAPWQRNVGMVFQNYALWPHMTVWDNVAFGLVERRVKKDELKARVGAALELVGLSAYGERRPNQLSGGQQQRVALARTVVIEPQVLLLDEPLSNLDKTLRVQMRQELLALQRRLGLTTIFVTHDQEEAMTTADRMAVLNHGVVQQVDTPEALYDTPVNTFVAGFVGTMNLLPARVLQREGGQVRLGIEGVGELRLPWVAQAPAGDDWVLSGRPDALRVVAKEANTEPGWHWLPATVQASEFMGELRRLRLALGPHTLAVDQRHTAGTSGFPVGALVQVGLPLERLRALAA